jgi:hypothetical protein
MRDLLTAPPPEPEEAEGEEFSSGWFSAGLRAVTVLLHLLAVPVYKNGITCLYPTKPKE